MTVAYDEFGLFVDNASEAGLPWRWTPVVRRVAVDGVSALVWGDAPPEIVLLHGGAQNAHTWDTVALALDRPLVAIDLPGHGHSAWRDDHDYRPTTSATAVAATIDALAPDAAIVVGMSLGGMTALALAGARPDLVRRLLLVDVTPGVNREKAADIIAFIQGPESFASFDEILERTVMFNPTRTVSSLTRGILHNAVERDDGSWTWRYDRPGEAGGVDADARITELGSLWDVVDGLAAPLLLARGSLSPVVSDEDVAELRRRRPDVEVVVVDQAGHSIQGDRPLAMAALITGWSHRPLA